MVIDDCITKMLKNQLLLSDAELLYFASTAPHRYKKYFIPKRNGVDLREIAHPSSQLKYVQRLLVESMVKTFPIHSSAVAYRKGISIRDNATLHLKNNYLLKMDFENFFNNITPEIFFDACEDNNISYSEKDKNLLKNILFYKKRRASGLSLSIGAPSSPLVSNFIMYQFDVLVSDFCAARNIVYSRYADDLFFSTRKSDELSQVAGFIKEILRTMYRGRLKINDAKTIHTSKKNKRLVTGVVLSSEDKLSIGREKKRFYSSMIHKFTLKLLDGDEIHKLQGYLSHAKNIEPLFISRMEKKYGHKALAEIMSYN
ncbi:retron St85 family RNA-directed DNA polymerase [Shewanella sp. 3B26]|uniref:RNA-directed DNA polymerase n=1 Tax=Shewanella zhuhaiensis TaxID=2919576 RepID=A0AAJ1EWE0_9GAMM|nr:retron St85 family RNA-directed DNA polymerase [Shewanella zhuhaiensis]MCH4292894.1 retron St85 family RNA-directed DNA polymerase [Shewanella zhuhaiensis]